MLVQPQPQSLADFFVRDVRVISPAIVTDRYGNESKSWADASSRAVRGWLSWRSEREGEDHSNREAQISECSLLLPAGDSITPADRVLISGQTFEVQGPIRRPWTPAGEHHVRVPLRAVEG